MSDYESDILVWSNQQSDLLRRIAAGETINEAVDWENIIEEIESVGRSEFNSVRTLLERAMTHHLKVRAFPLNVAVYHWQAEARAFRLGARRRFTPSMGPQIDLEELYHGARLSVPEMVDGDRPRALPETCPWTLEQLLSEAPL